MRDDETLVPVSYNDWDADDAKMTEWDADDPGGNGPTDAPYVFLQWKGIDGCIDLNCKCGELTHYDGDFAYALRCGACGRVYDMPSTVVVREQLSDSGVGLRETE